MKKIKFIIFTAILALPSIAFGLEAPPDGGIHEPITSGGDIGRSVSYDTDSFAALFTNLIDWFAWFVAVASVVIGLYAGFLFITSAGDEKKVKLAKDTIIYAVIGIIVAILSFSIVSIAQLFIEP